MLPSSRRCIVWSICLLEPTKNWQQLKLLSPLDDAVAKNRVAKTEQLVGFFAEAMDTQLTVLQLQCENATKIVADVC